MAHHEIAAHTSPDAEYRETPVGAEYEHTDANVWVIVKFGFWLVVTALVVHVGMGLMYSMLIEQAKDTAEQPYPLATSRDPQMPPAPRLQQHPDRDLTEFRATEERRLHGYGWVSKEAGVVHIPIEDAIRLTVQRGLPSRQEDPARAGAAPGMMASDASSGRVMERRRQ
jgi:hypothetical protein